MEVVKDDMAREHRLRKIESSQGFSMLFSIIALCGVMFNHCQGM
jgi:hypothetical protein